MDVDDEIMKYEIWCKLPERLRDAYDPGWKHPSMPSRAFAQAMRCRDNLHQTSDSLKSDNGAGADRINHARCKRK